MEFNNPITTHEEAKRFFQSFGCVAFFMGREFPDRYSEYRSLEIAPEVERGWANEYVLGAIECLEQRRPPITRLWAVHSGAARVFRDYRFYEHLGRLLGSTITIASIISQQDRLLVAETIVGVEKFRKRPGLIFLSYDGKDRFMAMGFADAARRLARSSFRSKVWEKRRLELLDNLAMTEQRLRLSPTTLK